LDFEWPDCTLMLQVADADDGGPDCAAALEKIDGGKEDLWRGAGV